MIGKRMMRTTCLLLVCVFVLSFCIGCDQTTSTNTANTANTSNTAGSSADNQGTITAGTLDLINGNIPESAGYIGTMAQITPVKANIEELGKKVNEKLGHKPVFLVANSNTSNDWSRGIAESAIAVIKSIGGEAIQTNAAQDWNKQVTDIENGMGRKVDAIIVVGGYLEALKEVLKKVKAENIPCVTIDVPSPDVVTNVTADNFGGTAQLLMQMCMDIGGKGNIVVGYSPGWHTFDLRRGMVDQVLKDFPDIKIVQEIALDEKDVINGTITSMTNILQKYKPGEINAAFFVFSLPALGASKALTNAGRKEIGVYSVDADRVVCKELEKGDSPFKAVVGQSIDMMGKTAAVCTLKGIIGDTKDLKRQTFVPTSLVTNANARAFATYNYADYK